MKDEIQVTEVLLDLVMRSHGRSTFLTILHLFVPLRSLLPPCHS